MLQLLRQPARGRLARPGEDLTLPWGRPFFTDLLDFGRDWMPDNLVPIDMIRSDDAITVIASVPGVDPEQIEVSIDRGLLTIAGSRKGEDSGQEPNDGYVVRERRVASFERSIRLPRGVNGEDASSRYANGELTITIPLAHDHKPRRIEVMR